MESNLFLTDEELIRMTGYKQPSKQIAFLEENFIKHIVNKKKRPVIFRCDVNYRRSLINDELLNVDKPSPTEELEPDFEALLRGKEKSS